ncbi:DUF6226 family protein [Microbacterium oryzae]|uniref:DUF6226 family protein n=1 Tax=Microbacterium oryzae TaxID=743009 RepID=UPI00339D401F
MLAIVGGNYRESVERGIRPWVEYAYTYPDGASSGRSRSRDLPAGRLKVATPVLRDLPEGWAPWPLSRETVF